MQGTNGRSAGVLPTTLHAKRYPIDHAGDVQGDLGPIPGVLRCPCRGEHSEQIVAVVLCRDGPHAWRDSFDTVRNATAVPSRPCPDEPERRLSLPEETQSFLSILARVSYIYTTKDSADKQKLVLLSGDYMSQEWVVKHVASCKTSVKAACEQLVDVIQTIKANMTQSSMMEALNQVQLTLSAPIVCYLPCGC